MYVCVYKCFEERKIFFAILISVLFVVPIYIQHFNLLLVLYVRVRVCVCVYMCCLWLAIVYYIGLKDFIELSVCSFIQLSDLMSIDFQLPDAFKGEPLVNIHTHIHEHLYTYKVNFPLRFAFPNCTIDIHWNCVAVTSVHDDDAISLKIITLVFPC